MSGRLWKKFLSSGPARHVPAPPHFCPLTLPLCTHSIWEHNKRQMSPGATPLTAGRDPKGRKICLTEITSVGGALRSEALKLRQADEFVMKTVQSIIGTVFGTVIILVFPRGLYLISVKLNCMYQIYHSLPTFRKTDKLQLHTLSNQRQRQSTFSYGNVSMKICLLF